MIPWRRAQIEEVVSKALVCIWLATLLLTATAAAADWHPQGLDKNCVLCQLRTNTTATQPAPIDVPEPCRAGWVSRREVPATLPQIDLISTSTRSPPAELLLIP